MNDETYLMDLKVKLAVSSSIQSVEIIDERIVLSDRGYFRARLFWKMVIFWKFQNILCVKMRDVSPKHIDINGQYSSARLLL